MPNQRPRGLSFSVRVTLWLLAIGTFASPAATPARLPAEAFAELPNHANVEMSPSGRYVAAKVYINGQYMLVIYDLDNIGTVKPLIANPNDMEVSWLRWKSDRRLLASLRFADRRYGTATVETRLFGLDPDGKNLKFLVPPLHKQEPVQIADRVVSFLPEDPDHILMAFNFDNPMLPRLYRVNVNTARKSLVEAGEKGIFWWTADQQGNPRIGEGFDDSRMLEKRFFRTADGEDWELVVEESVDDAAVFDVVMFDRKDPDLFYVRSNHEGDTTGLYRYRFSTRSFVDTIFRHPDVDVSSMVLDATGTAIHGVSYITDKSHTHWLDRRQADILDEVRSRIAARHVYMAAISADYRRAIVYAESPDIPGRYYLFEPATNKLQYFAHAYPSLDDQPMAPMRAVTYKARDGLEIPAFLSLPLGVTGKPARPVPAVIFPHGGPGARDYSSFDPMVQLFTSRGYAVLQPNFRGSWGYGAAFRDAGTHQWGQAMQDDVTDGTRWLISEGIADPGRICIVGWSYGGYAALMGVVKEPALYRCSASIAGVSDLRRLLEDRRQYLFGRIGTRLIGDLWKDRKSLEANSPVNRADEIQVPVLLAHGTSDRVVPRSQSDSMARALKRARKDYEYLKLDDADHSVLRDPERQQLFRALDHFLGRHLAP